MSSYISHIGFTDIVQSKSFLEAIQREVGVIKKMYIYTTPYEAGYLIRWEIDDSDYGFVREDF